jgi:hypothetical protein
VSDAVAKSELNLSINRELSRLTSLLSLLSHLLLIVFAIQDVPLPAAGRNMPGEREDFPAHQLVDMILPLEEISQDLLSLRERPSFVAKIRQLVFPQGV